MMRTALVCLVCAAPALAGEGVVVQIADGEVVFDLGRSAGLEEGQAVRFYRRLTVTHPISGKEMVDRFPIGEITPAEVGDQLSIAREVSTLSRPPKVGDFVVLERPPVPVVDIEPPAEPVPEVVDPESRAVERVMKETFGRPLGERAMRWEALLVVYPEGQYAESIRTEIASLNKAMTVAPAPAPAPAKTRKPKGPPPLRPRFDTPKEVVFGRPVELAIAVDAPDQVQSLRLLARRWGDRLFETTPFERAGDNNWRAHFSEAAVAEPGSVLYVVEAVRTNGSTEALVGSIRKPKVLEVTRLPPGRQPPGRSEARVTSEYVNFDNGGEDAYLHTEATFGYDLDFGVLQTIRVGVGSVDGSALVDADGRDYLDAPDDAEDSDVREITLNYAFAEAEVGAGTWVGLVARVVGGNHHATRDATKESVGGFEGRLRIGKRNETRLVLGGGFLGDIGDRYFADMHIAVFEKFPIVAGASVTNLPLNADDGYGLRLRTRWGWQVAELVSLDAILGWNARNINHHGVTVGGGLTLAW